MKKQHIATSYGTIHLYSTGSGPKPLVLLHGTGCDNAMLSWREVMEAFPDEYTIYAPDHLVRLKDIKAAAKKVPNGKLYIFPKGKHWSVKEKPHAFVEIIRKYY